MTIYEMPFNPSYIDIDNVRVQKGFIPTPTNLFRQTPLLQRHPPSLKKRIFFTIFAIIEKEQINPFPSTELQFLRERDVHRQGFS